MQVRVEIAAFQIVLASTKGVVIVGVKIQKWNTTQLAPFFFLTVCFQLHLVWELFHFQVLDLAKTGRCVDTGICQNL